VRNKGRKSSIEEQGSENTALVSDKKDVCPYTETFKIFVCLNAFILVFSFSTFALKE
jgi:hypothetical protein